MKNAEQLAQRTLELINPGVKQFDPLTLIALVQLISAVVSILKNCGYLDNEIQEKVSRPSWLMRFRLRRLSKQYISDLKLALAVADMLPVAASELSQEAFFQVYNNPDGLRS